MPRLKLSPPWEKCYREINLLFEKDDEIKIFYDSDNQEIKLYVDNPVKADALATILPEERAFGNVVLKITVVKPNKKEVHTKGESIYEEAFKENGVVSRVVKVGGLFDMTYVVFINAVVQYFIDDIGDINGNCSTLYQEIAKDIFKEEKGVFYCTETPYARILCDVAEDTISCY